MQTTDTVPSRGHLLEVGWLVGSAKQFGAPGSSLVALPEDEELPRDVAKLTGIGESELAGAPPFAEVWAEIAGSEAAACVIHYARFEKSFLDPAGATWPWEIICTHQLSRRLFPGLPAWGLRAVSGHLGHPMPLLQRAGPQAGGTMHVWRALVEKLGALGVTTLYELQQWQAQPAAKVPRRRSYMVEREKRLALPSSPGVYRMTARDGTILYVGKATNLKSRVSSYFRERTKRALRLSEMLAQVFDVQVEATESALEAALLETDEIKKFDPRYNTSLRVGGRGVRYCSRDFREITGRPDGDHPFGPFSTFGPLEELAYLQDLFDDPELPLEPIFTGLGRDSSPRASRGRRNSPDVEDAGRRCAESALEGPASTPTTEDEESGRISRPQRRAGAGRALESRVLFDQGVAKALGDARRDTDSLLRHGFHLLRRLGGESAAEEEDAEIDDDEWTVPLVVEKIEKTIYRAARHVLRGHWISRLGDATLAWRQGDRRRMIVFDNGAPLSRGFIDDDAELPTPPGWRRTVLERQAALDIGGYDRLRTVLTEIRALVDGHREVELRLSPRLRLTEKTLKRWLF